MRSVTVAAVVLTLAFGPAAVLWPGVSLADPAATLASGQALSGDAGHGAQLYEQRCSGCHSPAADRIGPRHNGVVGRRAGSVPGFAYSKALAQASFVWGPTSLDAWLANPEKFVPGQRMGYSVSNPADRADLIAYLSTLTAQ